MFFILLIIWVCNNCQINLHVRLHFICNKYGKRSFNIPKYTARTNISVLKNQNVIFFENYFQPFSSPQSWILFLFLNLGFYFCSSTLDLFSPSQPWIYSLLRKPGFFFCSFILVSKFASPPQTGFLSSTFFCSTTLDHT